MDPENTGAGMVKYEDPKVTGEWFALVRNVTAEYGMVDDDIYYYDETRFMMGIIFAGNREWFNGGPGSQCPRLGHPPFIILAAHYHLANWHTECNLRAD
ncbi:hypothetical protein BN1723_016250 [Verticillium longisporum]|uniref:Uncharacterized protein n=1 Tax=Verticillium longisporum TaxID=100787 RepID=A0A0G4MBC0_VERLO|nr:hypothetical protein BN1708_015977 [Verticillium longisporum]CRK43720.1 hypothetical protein BN1723_016250 [Verticillium longisporum]